MIYEGRKNKVRRLEDKNWYWVSKEIVNKYGSILKSSGLAVYNVLASFANSRSQTCFPTQQTIAEKIGVGLRTVSRKVRMLKNLNLIYVKRKRSRCLYFLLNPDTPKETREIRLGWRIRYATGGVYNNNKEQKLINNNYDDGFNKFKPIRRLLKRYDQST